MLFFRSLKLRSQAYQTEEFRKKVAHYSDFLAFLTEKTGVDFDENFFNLASLYSVLAADVSNLPSILNDHNYKMIVFVFVVGSNGSSIARMVQTRNDG